MAGLVAVDEVEMKGEEAGGGSVGGSPGKLVEGAGREMTAGMVEESSHRCHVSPGRNGLQRDLKVCVCVICVGRLCRKKLE